MWHIACVLTKNKMSANIRPVCNPKSQGKVTHTNENVNEMAAKRASSMQSLEDSQAPEQVKGPISAGASLNDARLGSLYDRVCVCVYTPKHMSTYRYHYH